MKHVALYDLSTGLFNGRTLTMPEQMLDYNIPPGMGAVEGVFNDHSQRVDLATGEVVAWRAPMPPGGDAMRAWSWDEGAQRWRSGPTERAKQLARVAQLEAGQARAIRALALNPADDQARGRLIEIEAAIDALGLRRDGSADV